MKLDVHERITILNLIPPTTKSDIVGLRELRIAREELSFSADEVDFFKIKITPQGGGYHYDWDEDRANERVKDCVLSRYLINLVRDKLVTANQKKDLSDEHVSLYKKFVEDYRP